MGSKREVWGEGVIYTSMVFEFILSTLTLTLMCVLLDNHLMGSRRERVDARAPPMECPVRKMRFPLPADVSTARSLSRTVLPGRAGST